jgi:transposase InsO family protein
VALALGHRRRVYRMIHLRLRQAGWAVNLKQVKRLWRQENLVAQKRKSKKLAFGDRQPLVGPSHAKEVWSMDLAFDRLADARTLKCLTVVDDATLEPPVNQVAPAESAHARTGILQ